jgi:hypothetical protein
MNDLTVPAMTAPMTTSTIATMMRGMRAMNALRGCSRALMPRVPTAADRNGMKTAKKTSLATMSLAS